MVSENFITLSLFNYSKEPSTTTLAKLSYFLSKNKLEIAKIYNDENRYTVFAVNNKLIVKVHLYEEQQQQTWTFKVVKIKAKR